jgi:hypothetical protein
MVSEKFQTFSNRLVRLLASDRFYVAVLVIFVLESAWIAFSALYPQAFDENFHFGLIQLYSHHWLPFLSGQPANADAYGAVARDPSYFYQYLMSFPYRFLALFMHSQAALVIAMRLIDVAFFTVGLALFRRVLLRVGLSRGLSNASLLLFILIPIVPALAAQVNYDDLLFPLTAWVCLETFNVIDELKLRKPSAISLLKLLTISLFACLVKYAFLPMLLSIVLVLGIIIYKTYRNNFDDLRAALARSFISASTWTKLSLSILCLIAIGLLVQREGVNVIKYHSVVPDCSRVLSVKQCSAYSPWYVDYQRHQQVLMGATPASENLAVYTWQWFYWMWYRLFFAVNGVASNFNTLPPLPLPSLAAVLVGLAGLAAVIKWRRRLLYQNPYLLFLLTLCVVYSASLFTKGYATYKYTAVLENMNGRYLLPILLPLAAIMGLAFSASLRRSTPRKAAALLVVLVLFLEGGGLLTFMVRSDQTWYWANPTVIKVNDTAHNVVRHVVVKRKTD